MTSTSNNSVWTPAESVVLVSHKDINLRAVDGKRPIDYGAWQISGWAARAANGDLLAMTNLIEPYCMAVVSSRDNGRTWTKPRPVWTNPRPKEFNAYVFGLKVLSSGRILAGINLQHQNPLDPGNPIFALYSDDHGNTWNEGQHANYKPFVTAFTPASIVEDSDGSLLMPIDGVLEEPKGRQTNLWLVQSGATGFVRSRDQGISWGETLIALGPDLRLGYYPSEPAYVCPPSGPWIMLVRLRTLEPAFLARSVSQDRGRSWSTPQLIGGDMANHGLLLLPDGGILETGMGSGGLKLRVSYDGGFTWLYEMPLEPSGDVAMSGLVLDESTVFLVYGSATGDPYHFPNGMPKGAYYYSGLRGRWVRKLYAAL